MKVFTEIVRLQSWKCLATAFAILAAPVGAGAQSSAALPSPWTNAAIGDAAPAGSASYRDGIFTSTAAGTDIQDSRDGFGFISRPVTGNVTITAHLVSQANTNEWAKAGVMIRAGLGADAKNVFLAATPAHGLTFQQRDAAGDGTAAEDLEGTASAWLRLQRVGPRVQAFSSADGTHWVQVGSATVLLPASVLVGLASASHQSGTSGKAVFDQVTVSQSAAPAADSGNIPLVVTTSAVDPATFHITARPADTAPPPVSPFVVQTAELPQAAGRAGRIQTAAGTLTALPGSRFRLQNKAGQALLPLVTVSEADGTITLTLKHSPQERFYGAGNQSENHAGDLTHPEGTQIVSNGVTRVPFLWSTGGWSLLVANNQTGSAWQDENGTLTWTLPGPFLDLYLSVAPDGYGLLRAYSRLTGQAPIPPRWAFGFMISRWGYADAADVQDKWQQFRDRKLPVDAFIYDYDWFVNDFQFNPKTFPAGSLTKMKKLGLHFVGIRKPRVTGANLDYARSQGWILTSPLGTDLRFDLPVARYWWWSKHIPLVQAGVDGWWNDEAEQSADEFFGMAQTEWDGWHAMSRRRAWSISRAFAPGMQRFGAAAWTGDINSTGQDIGGFQSTPSPELYTRWMEEGVFVPVMRAHGTYNSPRWPWAFGDDALAATKKALELRYRLIPYFYTFAAQTAATGRPLMRPLFLEFPGDARTFNLEDEWLMGDRLLAAPGGGFGGGRGVFHPPGGGGGVSPGAAGRGGQTLHLQASLDTIPAYVRAGTILPLGPALQATGLRAEDPLEVRVYPGADAAFTLYEDDGDTYAYQTGAASRIPMRWNNKARTLTVGARTGSFPGMLAVRHLVIHLPGGSPQRVTYAGQPVQVHL